MNNKSSRHHADPGQQVPLGRTGEPASCTGMACGVGRSNGAKPAKSVVHSAVIADNSADVEGRLGVE